MSNASNNNYSDDNYPIVFEPNNPPAQVAPMGTSQNMMYVNQSDVQAIQQAAAQLAAENKNLVNVCNYLSFNNAHYQSTVDALERQNEALRRNRRKKVTSISAGTGKKDGVIYLFRHYDDGGIVPERLITNCEGYMELFVIKGSDFDLPKEYVLIMVGEQKCIILERKNYFVENISIMRFWQQEFTSMIRLKTAKFKRA